MRFAVVPSEKSKISARATVDVLNHAAIVNFCWLMLVLPVALRYCDEADVKISEFPVTTGGLDEPVDVLDPVGTPLAGLNGPPSAAVLVPRGSVIDAAALASLHRRKR